jgi:hypothetical protein
MSPLNRGLIEHSEENFRCYSTHFFPNNSRAGIIAKKFILRNPTTCGILWAILRDGKDKPIQKIEKIASMVIRVAIIVLSKRICDQLRSRRICFIALEELSNACEKIQ